MRHNSHSSSAHSLILALVLVTLAGVVIWPATGLNSPAAIAVSGGADSDGDGIPDDVNNCVNDPNPDQCDTDGDGFGNMCDADLNNDGLVNFIDLGLLKAAMFMPDQTDADLNCDGQVNFLDLGIMKGRFFRPPG